MTNPVAQAHDGAGADRDRDGARIGLALSGGAALGWAHVGALRALTEMGVRPYCVSGVSMGAIVGVAFADGHLDDLEQFARDMGNLSLARLLRIGTRRGGWLSNRGMARAITSVLDHDRIEALPMRFGAGCADLASGTFVALTDGAIATAIQASTAVPGVFEPVRVDGRILVDGGIVDLVPVSLCRRLGADRVIAIDVLQDFRSRARKSGFVSDGDGPTPGSQKVLWTSLALLLSQLAGQGRVQNPPDITICPSVGSFSPLAFKQAKRLIELGYEAVQAQADGIRTVLTETTASPVQPRNDGE